MENTAIYLLLFLLVLLLLVTIFGFLYSISKMGEEDLEYLANKGKIKGRHDIPHATSSYHLKPAKKFIEDDV